MNQNVLNRYRTDGLASQSPQRLLVLLYQRLATDLDRAEACLDGGDHGGAHAALVHAQEIVAELQLALDPSAWPGGPALADLYRYLAERLVTANVTKSVPVVRECRAHVAPLVEAWEEAYKLVQAGARTELDGRVVA